jgi:hypothetical protein
MIGRFAWGLRSFLRETITLEQAREAVRRRLAERERNFLRLIERGVYSHSRSPFLPLLEMAGCELGDIQNLVRANGLEKTLLALREAGVYITFEEFKGRQPIVRDGKVFHVRTSDFDNPYLRLHYYSESGGSTGAGTRVAHDLDHLAVQAAALMLTHVAHNVLDVPTAVWRGILPDGSGIDNVLRTAHFGRVPQRWFSPVVSRNVKPALKYRLATYFTVVTGRMLGVAIPWPELVPLDKASVVARWAAQMAKTHGACLVIVGASRALRVCLAARQEGLDLTGVTFAIAGEPITSAKVQGITRTGARYFTTYGFSEAGRIGMGCGRPAECNDLHLLKDICAIIQYQRQVPGSEIIVPAFNVTSLLPTAPKILLNVESDDYGILETRSCACPLEDYGYDHHLRDIHSFSKLTGEGVTIVGSEMIHILEEVLPARFGGSPLDYQLTEEEDEDGFTRVSLLVSPKIEIEDESAVIEAVLNALARESVGADVGQALWRQAGALRVRRSEPIWTDRGKLMPLHVAKRSTRSS